MPEEVLCACVCMCVCVPAVCARACVYAPAVCARMRACVRACVCVCISSYMVIIKSYNTNMPKYPFHLNTMQFLHKTRHVAQGRVKSGQPLPSVVHVVKRKRTEDANSPETECANIFICMLFLFVGWWFYSYSLQLYRAAEDAAMLVHSLPNKNGRRLARDVAFK